MNDRSRVKEAATYSLSAEARFSLMASRVKSPSNRRTHQSTPTHHRINRHAGVRSIDGSITAIERRSIFSMDFFSISWAGEYLKSRCCAMLLLRCCFVAASISSIHRIAAAGVCECLKPQEAERALLSPSYSYYDRRVPLLAITIMSITSDEVNYLIYRYLQESGAPDTRSRMRAISLVECLRLIARGWM